jgi:hypothetical protein
MPVAGAVRVFLVAGGYAGAAGETLNTLLGPAPWSWTALLARGAVWGVAATLVAGLLRWRVPEVLTGLSGPWSASLLAALSFLIALGLLAVAVADPRPAGPALAALVLAGAGIAWGRAARAGRPADRPGSA